MAESTISATVLSKNLSDILNRVRYRGEEFVVERGGEPVARILPAAPSTGPTFRELVERLLALPGDSTFADDLERVQANQPTAEVADWPS
jgi:prevent-host-death family protein